MGSVAQAAFRRRAPYHTETPANPVTVTPSMGRNDMAVHAAQESLWRDLASGGSWVIQPGIVL